MGPPTGRAPVVDDIRPPQPERRGQAYHPQPEQQHAQPQQQHTQQHQQQGHISVNNDYTNNQTHTSNNPPQTRTRPPQPDTHFRDHRMNNDTPNQDHRINNSTPNQDHRINNSTPDVSTQYPIDYSPHDQQGNDSPDGPMRSHVNVTVDVCTEQEVCDSTPDLLTTFIVGRMERDGISVPQALSLNRKRESDIAHVLRDIGDDIMKNYQLNRYINEIVVTPNTAYKTFESVASQIFSDGSINWGRIVMLFYFAYKLALQVLNQLPLLEIIIRWVKQFVTDRLAAWITSRGGWNAIREYYQSNNTQMFGMFVAGFLVASCLFWYLRKK